MKLNVNEKMTEFCYDTHFYIECQRVYFINLSSNKLLKLTMRIYTWGRANFGQLGLGDDARLVRMFLSVSFLLDSY